LKGIKAFLGFLGEILVYTPRKLSQKSEFAIKKPRFARPFSVDL
jgi:hypothetical protein